jgi:hypothetical protein
VHGVEVSSANVHDATELDAVLPPEPGAVYGGGAAGGARGTGIERSLETSGIGLYLVATAHLLLS